MQPGTAICSIIEQLLLVDMALGWQVAWPLKTFETGHGSVAFLWTGEWIKRNIIICISKNNNNHNNKNNNNETKKNATTTTTTTTTITTTSTSTATEASTARTTARTRTCHLCRDANNSSCSKSFATKVWIGVRVGFSDFPSIKPGIPRDIHLYVKWC